MPNPPRAKPASARPDHNGPQRAQFASNKKKIFATQRVCGICGGVDMQWQLSDFTRPRNLIIVMRCSIIILGLNSLTLYSVFFTVMSISSVYCYIIVCCAPPIYQ